MRQWVLASLALLALTGSAWAASPAPIPMPARPPAVDAAAIPGPVASAPTDTSQSQKDAASTISQQVFGGAAPGTDDAYGAFQRGAYLTALAFALPRAQNNDAAAQTLIGEIYGQGLGVGEDDAKAAGWFDIASKHGDKLASFELATMLQQGNGVPKDGKRAAELFQQSADAGYMPAKYNLALMYMSGLDVPPDLLKAAALLKEAADSGLADAQYDYGTMLVEGGGMLPDVKQGATEIGLAAKQGLAAAQVDYATMLYLGKGLPRDLGEAVHWYRAAAEQGNPVAQVRYGKLLAVGEGVPIDMVEAAMYRSLARRQGLSDQVLDKLLAAITPEQRKDAEELAFFWPSGPPSSVPASGNPVAADNSDEKTLPTGLDGYAVASGVTPADDSSAAMGGAPATVANSP